MKKLISLILCVAVFLSLVSCGKKEVPNSKSNDQEVQPEAAAPVAPIEPEQEVEEESNPVEIETEEKILTVDVTFPASMFEGEDMSSFDADSYATEQGFEKAVVNSDGSITVTMTKSKHAELLEETARSVEDGYASMVRAEDTPYITEITHSDDFSSIDMKVIRADYDAGGLQSAFVPLVAFMPASIYQSIAGIEARSEINVIDADTGDVIDSVIYPDALED